MARVSSAVPAPQVTVRRSNPATPAPARPTPPSAIRKEKRNRPLWVMASTLVGINLLGAPYYLLPLTERVRSPLHLWYKPSGYVGQSAGILAFAIFIFLWLYPLRKKFRWLAFTGAVGRWLDVHVTVALVLPLLLAIHSAWRFEGLIGLGFGAILVVCASGVIGRYLYARIPRSRNGIELSIEEVTSERRTLLTVISEATGIAPGELEESLRVDPVPYAGLGIMATLRRMLADDLARWRTRRVLTRRWLARTRTAADRDAVRRAVALASREIALTQQSRMLGATHQIFRYWHVAHRPFALTALGAVLVHVAVVVALGVTWLW